MGVAGGVSSLVTVSVLFNHLFLIGGTVHFRTGEQIFKN